LWWNPPNLKIWDKESIDKKKQSKQASKTDWNVRKWIKIKNKEILESLRSLWKKWEDIKNKSAKEMKNIINTNEEEEEEAAKLEELDSYY
jgi:hypothetical protein